MKFDLSNPVHNKLLVLVLFILAPVIISAIIVAVFFLLILAWVLLPFGAVRGNGKLGYVLEFPWAK